MGCGCGGGGRKGVSRSNSAVPRPSGAVRARTVQTQAAQRQAAAQRQVSAQQSPADQPRNSVGSRDEMERRRRIQVALRKRNSGG